MVEIIEWAGQASPDGFEDCSLVKVAHGNGSGMIRHSRGATFYSEDTPSAVERAVDLATVWALNHSVETVYVMRNVRRSAAD